MLFNLKGDPLRGSASYTCGDLAASLGRTGGLVILGDPLSDSFDGASEPDDASLTSILGRLLRSDVESAMIGGESRCLSVASTWIGESLTSSGLGEACISVLRDSGEYSIVGGVESDGAALQMSNCWSLDEAFPGILLAGEQMGLQGCWFSGELSGPAGSTLLATDLPALE
jgi:hypothetical protein